MKRIFYGRYIGISFLYLLSSCTEQGVLAPVVELSGQAVNPKAKYHIVSQGETLYSVAFRYDQDYRNLARLNHLTAPYTLYIGEQLRLYPEPNHPVYSPPRHRILPPSVSHTIHSSKSVWLWPVHGRILLTYQPKLGRKGIDIAGTKGSKIRSVARGQVAYAGHGILGYGNLIIIKHEEQYLSAYGNNAHIYVKEGQYVQAGQVIGEIGIVEQRYWGIHFELRHFGKPVDPLRYLGRANG